MKHLLLRRNAPSVVQYENEDDVFCVVPGSEANFPLGDDTDEVEVAQVECGVLLDGLQRRHLHLVVDMKTGRNTSTMAT